MDREFFVFDSSLGELGVNAMSTAVVREKLTCEYTNQVLFIAHQVVIYEHHYVRNFGVRIHSYELRNRLMDVICEPVEDRVVTKPTNDLIGGRCVEFSV